MDHISACGGLHHKSRDNMFDSTDYSKSAGREAHLASTRQKCTICLCRLRQQNGHQCRVDAPERDRSWDFPNSSLSDRSGKSICDGPNQVGYLRLSTSTKELRKSQKDHEVNLLGHQ